MGVSRQRRRKCLSRWEVGTGHLTKIPDLGSSKLLRHWIQSNHSAQFQPVQVSRCFPPFFALVSRSPVGGCESL